MAGLMTLLMLTQYIPMPTQAKEEPLTIEMDPVDVESVMEEALVWEEVAEMENITAAASAETITSGDFKYYVNDDGTATIAGFVGEESGFLVPVEQQTEVPEGYIGIYTAEDLDNVRNSIFANYILMNDIDLSGYENWKPISYFDGIFDGNGFTISNMVMSITNDDADYNSIGLFCQVYGASIQNLSMQDCHIKLENTVFGYVGLISGTLSNSEIDNCIVSGEIEYTNEEITNTISIVGGVSGYLIRSSVQNIKSDVNINVDFYNASAYVGGMFGQIYDVNGDFTINNLQNEGNVIVYENGLGGCGGISGGLTFCSTTSTVENIMNSGNLQYTMNDAYKKLGNVGGVFGVMSAYDSAYVKVAKLKNIAKIQSNSAKSGGIVGSFQNPTGSGESFETGISYIEFTHMYNSGMLDCSDIYASSQYETQGIGGLFGVINYTETNSSDDNCSFVNIAISDSYNSGYIQAVHESDISIPYISGIIGMGWVNYNENIENTYNNLSLRNIYNTGNIDVLIQGDCNANIHDIVGLSPYFLTDEIDITSCYYPSYSNANCIVDGCTSLSDTEMQSASSFVGFDFENVWEIGVTEDYPYPTLRDNSHNSSKTLWCPTLNVTPGSASTQTHFEWYIISGLTDNATGFYLEVYDETHSLYPVTTTASGSTMYVVTMPQSPGNYTATLYAIYEDGTRVKGNTVSYTVAGVTSPITTTWDTSPLTLSSGECYNFSGTISSVSPLDKLHIAVVRADNQSVGIDYYREIDIADTFYDLSYVPSITAGDLLYGLQVTNNQSELSLTSGTYLIRMWITDTEGNYLDNLSKAITITDVSKAPVVRMLPITEVTASTATLQAEVVDTKGGIIVDYGFNLFTAEMGGTHYAQYSASHTDPSFRTAMYDPYDGVITVELQDYDPDQTYWVEAFAVYYEGDTRITGISATRECFTTDVATIAFTAPEPNATLSSDEVHVAGSIACQNEGITFSDLTLHLYDYQMQQVSTTACTLSKENTFSTTLNLTDAYGGTYYVTASVTTSVGKTIVSRPVGFHIPGKLTVYTDVALEENITATTATVTGSVEETLGETLAYYGFRMYNGTEYIGMIFNQSDEPATYNAKTGVITAVLPADPGTTISYEAFVSYYADGVQIDSISHQRQTLTTKRVDIQLDRINNYKKDSYMLDDTAGALKIHGHLANIAADCTVGTPVVEVTDSSGNVKDTVTAVGNGTNFTATLDMSQYPVGVYTITAQVEDETGRVSVSNGKKAVMPQKATEITFKTNLGGEVLSQDEVHIIPHYKYLVVDLDIDTSRSDIDKIEWSTSSTSGLPLHVWNESEGYFDTKRPQTCQYTAVSCGKYTITATVYNHDGSTVSASLDVEVRAQAILCFVDYVTQTPLENVNVQITSKNDPSYSVQAKTNAAGQITLQDVTYGSYSIYATASGHNPLDIVQVIGDGSDMTIPVYDDDHIVYSANMTAVYTSEGENIMTDDNVDILYTSTRLITGRDYLVSIRVVANASKTISKYQLIQDSKVLGESTSADTSIVLQSLRQCKKNKDVYIRVCYTDGTYKQEKTQLRFENTVFTAIANNLTNGDAGNMSLNLGNEFSVKLPDSVPIFGGQEMKLDLLDIPASFKVADNKVHIIIGAEDMFEDNSDKRDGALVWEAKKMGVQEDIINATKAVKKAMSSGNLSSALDMLEKDLLNFKKDKMAEKEAKIFGTDIVPVFLGTGTYDLIEDEWEISIVMQVMIEWEKDFQYFPAGVPVVLTIKIETKVGSEGKLNLIKVVDETDATKTYWKADAREFYPVVSLGLTLGGGFGVSDIATITAEGKGEVEGKAKLSPELKIALGFNLHLQILVWEHIEELAGIEWKLEDGEWWTKTLYPNWTKVDTSESTLTNITALSPYNIPISQYTLSDRSYLNNTTDWYADNGVAAFASITDESYTTQMDTLMSYIYPDTQLQTVQTADNKVMVWLTDDATRDAANRTKLVYAVYDPVLEMWSVPQSVADDGTLDSYPCLTTDGTSIWAAWVNMGTALTDDMTLEDSMCQTEICVAMFDPQTMSFRHVTTLTQNTMIDLMPSITVSGDRIAVAWVNNDNGDLWGTSGTNTIYVSLYDGSTWSAPQVVKTLDTAVTDMKIGFVDGDLCVAYCCDTDNSLETIEDIAVSLIDLDTGVAYVLAETGLNASLQYTTIQNAQLLTWYATGSIMSLRTLGETPVDLLNGKSVNSDYRIVSDVHGTVILCTVSVENGSELYVSAYDPIENAWSNNIRLTYQNNAYINDFGALMEPSGDITVMYTAESGDMAQMCSGTIQFIKDISLDSVSTALFDAIPGQMTSLYAEITNHGIATVESVVVQLRDGETILSEITMPLELAAGETMSLEVPVRAPATDGVREYTVAVLLPDEEIDDSNNISKVSFGYSSMLLSLTDLYGDEARLLQFTVTNNSGYDTNATLTLYKDDENRTVLDSIHVGTVAGKSNVQVSYTLTDLSESLYFVLEGDRTEYYLDDNEIYYDLSTNNGYAITGQITGNDPTKVATIQLLQNGVVIYTDTAAATEGTFQTFAITDVPDGIYTLVFSKQGHLPQTMENIVVNGADVALSDAIVMTAGDVDGNGVLDANDLLILKQYFSGYATDVDLSSYDVNGDGVFTRADVMYLARTLNAWENYAIPNRS